MTPEEIHNLVEKVKAENAARSEARKTGCITREEGLYIQYKLKCKGLSCAEIARELDCERQAVQRVISGKTRSGRIESKVATVLGYETWNTMIKAMRTSAA